MRALARHGIGERAGLLHPASARRQPRPRSRRPRSQPPTPPAPQDFPALYRVTFFYFLGRTELYNENVELAAKRLGDALAATRRDAAGHKRAILRYLVPVGGAHRFGG